MKKLKFINGNIFEYEILNLVDFYDPILRTPTQLVDVTDNTIAYAALSLMETLNKLNGLALSANQVGLPYRMFALNVGEQIWCLANPVVISTSKTKSKYQEGCLSYPGLYLNIGRPESVVIEYDIIGGQRKQQQFDGLTATCVLHELDHLDGIVYTDKVPRIKLQQAKEKIKMNLKKMKKIAQEA